MQVTQKRKELFQVLGDAPEPGGKTCGVAGTYDLTVGCIARTPVYYAGRFGEFVLTIDVYSAPDSPMYLLLICPACSNADRSHGLKISADNKHIDFEPQRIPKLPGMTTEQIIADLGVEGVDEIRGGLSVEKFSCTFEAEPDLRRHFGLAKCGFRVAIDNNIARDA